MIAVADPAQVQSPAQPPKAIVKANPIETLERTVSASRLNCWLGCRLKFYFRYVQQIPKPKTASLHVGSVVHLILQAWNMARWRKQAFEIERFKKLFEEGWKDQTQINWDGEVFMGLSTWECRRSNQELRIRKVGATAHDSIVPPS